MADTSLFLQQLLTLPTVDYALLSPDGRWVAFTWYRKHANLDVFLVPTDGSHAPVALTHTDEATELVGWTSDSRAVIVSEDHAGDERSRLFLVNINSPGVMQPLTEDRPPYYIRGGDLHPNGRYLFYGANYDFKRAEEIEPTWIYRHDLSTGERTLIACPGKPNWVQPMLSRDGTALIYTRKDLHPAGRQIYLVDSEGKHDREILNFGDQVKVFARWFPDSQNILFLCESGGDQSQEYIRLGVYHIPSQAIRWLVDDPKRTIDSAWVSPNGLVVVDEVRQAGHKPSTIDLESGKETHFPPMPGNLLPLGQAADGAWIAMYYSSVSPTELVRMAFDSRSPDDFISLTRVWEQTPLKPEQLIPAEDFRWNSVDGLEIQGWLYRARPNSGQAIVYVHGGPSWHSEDRLNAQIQYLIQRGFNILDVNYRGSTGFGLKFREAIKIDGWGGLEQADIASGAQALIQNDLAKAGRVSVTGTSYGGYSAWYQITHNPPEIIGAAAPICGMTDLVVDYETTRPDLRPLSEEMMGGKPDGIPERYYERSPIHFVQNVRGRLLIVQGARDPNVTPENVRQVESKLEEYNIPYELLVFDDEGHGILKPANQEKLYMALADFFGRA